MDPSVYCFPLMFACIGKLKSAFTCRLPSLPVGVSGLLPAVGDGEEEQDDDRQHYDPEQTFR